MGEREKGGGGKEGRGGEGRKEGREEGKEEGKEGEKE